MRPWLLRGWRKWKMRRKRDGFGRPIASKDDARLAETMDREEFYLDAGHDSRRLERMRYHTRMLREKNRPPPR